MAKFKWDSPADWLGDKINRERDAVADYLQHGVSGEVSFDDAYAALMSLSSIAKEFAMGDSDTIQDAMQDDMEQDGYFRDEDIVLKLTRKQCVELLEGVDIQCYDSEDVGALREAVWTNVDDGVIGYGEVEAMANGN